MHKDFISFHKCVCRLKDAIANQFARFQLQYSVDIEVAAAVDGVERSFRSINTTLRNTVESLAVTHANVQQELDAMQVECENRVKAERAHSVELVARVNRRTAKEKEAEKNKVRKEVELRKEREGLSQHELASSLQQQHATELQRLQAIIQQHEADRAERARSVLVAEDPALLAKVASLERQLQATQQQLSHQQQVLCSFFFFLLCSPLFSILALRSIQRPDFDFFFSDGVWFICLFVCSSGGFYLGSLQHDVGIASW